MKKTFAIWLVLCLMCAGSMLAAVPQQINYQGYLTDTGGSPLDTTVAMTFKLYTDSLAGNLLWTETRPSVSVAEGLFNVRLGQITTLGDNIFNNAQVWLGITVGNNSEMTPRSCIVSVGYSYRVGTVDGASGGTVSGTLNVGSGNLNPGTMAMVAGQNNRARGSYSVVAGGGGGSAADSNSAQGAYSTIGGGHQNKAGGENAAVAGGTGNWANGVNSAVVGGTSNYASGSGTFIGSGGGNTSGAIQSAVVGGLGNTASANLAFIGGGHGNVATGTHSVIGGGEYDSTRAPHSVVGGGSSNIAADTFAVVAGGLQNTARGCGSTVSGGVGNSATEDRAAIGGGDGNVASGYGAVVAGGDDNSAGGDLSTIAGGHRNEAAGRYAFAAGRRAHAMHDGTFVWADSTDSDFASTDTNQFLIRAGGGVGIGLTNPAEQLEVNGDVKADTFRADAGIQFPDGTVQTTAAMSGTPSGWTDDGTRVRLTTSTDSVGIGTASPTERLDVSGNLRVIGKANIGPSNANTGTYAFVAGRLDSALGLYSTVCGGYQNVARYSYATVGGGWLNNNAGTNATIAGGHDNEVSGSYSAIGGGESNAASGDHSFVGGGASNDASNGFATVSGGHNNTASGYGSFVGGGQENIAGLNSTVGGGLYNLARGVASVVGGGGGPNTDSNSVISQYGVICGGRAHYISSAASSAFIGGGYGNQITDLDAVIAGGNSNLITARYSAIPGGRFNIASGQRSFVAGEYGQSTHQGSFVWSSGGDTTASWGNNTFTARAPGGVRFYTDASLTNVGASLAGGSGTWAALSDSAMKRRCGRVDTKDILDKVAALSIERWSYKTQDESIQHIGPMAQDFYKLFGCGDDDKSISTIDPDGIALAAIQELQKQNEELMARNSALEREVAEIKIQLQQLSGQESNSMKQASFTQKTR
jgi:hypothetical protein